MHCPAHPFLEAFLNAYIEAALWSSCDEHGHFDKRFDENDIDPATLAQMENDCLRFYTEHEIEPMSDHDQKRAGHDFWLTRNRHGAGFWDGDWHEPFATLATEDAHSYGEFDLYVGDDNRVYGTPLHTQLGKEQTHEAVTT